MPRTTFLDDDFYFPPLDSGFSAQYNFLNFSNLLSPITYSDIVTSPQPETSTVTSPALSSIALAALSLTCASCGGDSQTTQSPIPVPVTQPTAAPIAVSKPSYVFQKIVSQPVSIKNILIAGEALTVADINGDGKKDIILSNAGDGSVSGPSGSIASSMPLKATDNKTTVFINNGDNTFSLLDTSNIRVTGWVNDWVILPNPTGGNPYIVGIDHGRETGGIANFSQWNSKLPVFQMRDGILVDLTDSVSNVASFYHNSSNYGDLNNDGIADFVTANMNSFNVFYGDKQSIFKDVTDTVFGSNKVYTTPGSQSYIGSTGAALIIDIGGDKQNDIVLLPYCNLATNEGSYADVFKYSNGTFSEKYTFLVRNNNQIPDSYGFHTAKVVDINRDGLDDIVAMMESKNGSNNRIFSVMLQNKSGTFDVSFVSDHNSILLGPGENSTYRTDAKFELFDIDGDGNLDIYMNMFFGSDSDKTQGVYFGDGKGNFATDMVRSETIFQTIDWKNYCARTIMADFNDDGRPDLLTLNVTYDSSSNPLSVTPTVFINNYTFA